MTSRSRPSRHLVAAALLALIVLPTAGCSARVADKWRRMMPPTHPVSGTVKYKGSPLTAATVVFHPRDGLAAARRAAAGLTDSAGRFVLTTVKPGDGAIAGPYLVTVEKTTAADPGALAVPPDEFGVFPLGADPTVAKPLIPAKYASPGSSGLAAEVVAAEPNEFTFTLE